jgi:DNA-directed RNA polymerase
MNSEFPTSFAQESDAVKSVRDNKSSRDRHGAVHQKRSSGRQNVIPMSRAADSMLVTSSNIKKGSESADSVGYPMSEFDDRSSHHQGERRSPVRLFLRMTLGSVLVGLWISIAMGHLHSDSQFINGLRTAISSILGSSDVEQKLSLEEVSPNSQPQTTIMDAAKNANPAAENPAAEKLATENPAAVAASSVQQASIEPNESKASIGAPSSPASMLPADLEKMAKLYADQGAQLNAMEEHIVRLMVEHASPESLSSFLDSMERRHLAALNSMKAIKETGKRSAR